MHDDNNRLRVSEDGSFARCELVGLLPFHSIRNNVAHENALAVSLAIRHLNNGDGSIVEELNGFSCPILFSASFASTQRNPSQAFAVVDELTRPLQLSLPTNATNLGTPQMIGSAEEMISAEPVTTEHAVPCAFVGAFDSQISKTTALLTGLRGIPQISPGSTSTSLNEKNEYPLFGRTLPDDSFMAETFVRFLHDTLGVRHFFVIFESHPYTRSVVNSLRDAIRNLGWAPDHTDAIRTSGVAPGDENDGSETMYLEAHLIESDFYTSASDAAMNEAIKALRTSQYRFVLSLMTGNRTDVLMEAAYHQGVAGNGSYHWWFYENPTGLTNRTLPKDSILAKAYNGTGNIMQFADTESSKYEQFRQQSIKLKRELYSAIDKNNNGSGENWLFSPDSHLGENEWLTEEKARYFTPPYAYDATILLGLSACSAIADPSSTPFFLTGSRYFDTIRQTNFTGVTGNVTLDPITGTRDGHTIQYTINNWLAVDINEADGYKDGNSTNMVTFQPTETHVYAPGGDNDWEEVLTSTFVYSNGKTSLGEHPDLPPLEPTYLGVKSGVKWLAYVSCAIILVSTLGCAIWTYIYRESRVVRASQPFFLCLLCLGIAVMALSMIPISVEHSSSSDSKATCNSIAGLFIIGFGICFSTLFAKTYRIHKIMDSAKKFRRIQLSVADTIYPVAIITVFNVIMLTLMITYSPLVLEVVPTATDDFGRTTEEYKSCNYDSGAPWFYIILGVNLGVLCLALYEAYGARNLSTEFAESHHIAYALLISFIVSILAIPVIFLAQMNPNIDTFIETLIVTALTGSTLGFMFIPKIRRHHNSQQRSTKDSTLKSAFDPSSKSGTKLSVGNYGEQIVTTKPQERLASEIRSLERELDRVKKIEKRLELQNASLRDRIQELEDETRDNGGKSNNSCGTSSKSGSIQSGETFEFMAKVPSVMEDEDCDHVDVDDQLVRLQGLDKTSATAPAIDDTDNLDYMDKEEDLESNAEVADSSARSSGSFRGIISSLSGKFRSDRSSDSKRK